ncbi:MAG: rhodanese-like domain-containing protein, partial [Dehalococcoidia bacterium]
FVDEALGNSSYLVGSRRAGVCAVIDPDRDVDKYLAAAAERALRIVYTLDTHVHNDFVSGSRELAARTGAEIGASAGAQLQFDHRPLREGDEIDLGSCRLQVIETPGHTPEHISYLAFDGEGQRTALFSGGSLLVGSVARTDLLGEEMTGELSRLMFRTVSQRLAPLSDDLLLYPTHGAGSFCTATPAAEMSSTIGEERQFNPFLTIASEEEFVQAVLADLPPCPPYFRRMRPLNQQGPRILGGLPAPAPHSPQGVYERLDRGLLVLDVRPATDFDEGHVPGAYNIGLDGPFTVWAGWVLPTGATPLLVGDGEESVVEAVRHLIGIGYDEYEGYLQGDMAAWRAAGLAVASVPQLTVQGLAEGLADGGRLIVLDVRNSWEWAAGHIEGAIHMPLGDLPQRLAELPRDAPLAVHCAHAHRSGVAVSILQAQGFERLHHLVGGISAWEEAGYEVARGG